MVEHVREAVTPHDVGSGVAGDPLSAAGPVPDPPVAVGEIDAVVKAVDDPKAEVVRRRRRNAIEQLHRLVVHDQPR